MGARVREGYGAGSLLAACQGEGSLTGWKGVWLSQAQTPFSSTSFAPLPGVYQSSKTEEGAGRWTESCRRGEASG